MSDLAYRNLGINIRTAKKLDDMWLLSGITKSELMDISLSIVYEMMISLCQTHNLTYKEALLAISEQVPKEMRQKTLVCYGDGLRSIDEILKSISNKENGGESMSNISSSNSESADRIEGGDGQC